MSSIITARLDELVEDAAVAGEELEEEVALLRATIATNRGDYHGLCRRVRAIKERSDNLTRLVERVAELHDLRYKTPTGSVDPRQPSAVEEACPPTKLPPPPL